MSRWLITFLALSWAMSAQAQFPRPPAPPRPPSLPGNVPLPPPPKVPLLPNPSPKAANVNGPVVQARRALLVVSAGLKKHGDPKYGALYQFLESSGASSAREGLSGVYGKVVVLEGRDGTVDKFLNTLYSLARNYDAVDLVLHQHGLPGQLVFEDKAVSVDDLGKSIKEGTNNSLGKMPESSRRHLRLVWETACYGQSHANGWIKAGFQMAVGARGVHADSMASFPAFVSWWRSGYSVLRTTEAANRADSARLLDRWAAGPLGFKDVNSERVITGMPSKGDLTIGSPPWP